MISHLVQSGKVLQHLKLDDIESTIICIQELLRRKLDSHLGVHSLLLVDGVFGTEK